ncbi:N-6 DNA methylase, partial [candidate division KSB1 bacterium]|nr:N-6 DNA methylase [candidate division KSB1 bacterium]
MGIFQKSVLNKYLKNLDPAQVQTAYGKFQRFYGDAARLSNIELLKEESYQEGFLREIFVQVLGYTINPDPGYNLTTEFKNLTDSKKADGAILRNGEALGVIELKSTRTFDLERIKQQAFSYKNNQPACKYVITSNFHFLRFYIDNATEYEEFDLFELTETDFQKFYLLLAGENLLADVPEKMKAETKFHEENISDRFYKDYSAFKRKIFENLILNNPQYDKLTLFQKSQKLLDRLLFVFFAEDSGLVPPNAISRIIEQWNQLQDLEAYQPLYDRFKLFFSHLNTGHKYQTYELSEYNGGLFAPDEILDYVKIDDPILHIEALKLSTYDFSTEIDVNILGHIFEHSLAEIEEISAELEGAPVDRKQSKRKKEGIFYTPKYITQYIVENTVGALCQEKKAELGIADITIDESFRKKDGKISVKGKELFKILETYKEWLLSLKILDPACGSGAFLNQALEFLIAEHRALDGLIQEVTNEALGLFDTDKEILENNLYGVDLNEESVEIAKLSLWLRTARKGRQLSTLNENIKCGNSLIDDPAVAGTKAFNWEKEFPEIFAKGGFDVVMGNPPYGAFLENPKYYENKYFLKRFDSYQLFVMQSLNLIIKNGILGFIIPNSWMTHKYGSDFRNLLIKFNFEKVLNFRKQVFCDANIDTTIIIIKKDKDSQNIIATATVEFPEDIISYINYNLIPQHFWENYNKFSCSLKLSDYVLFNKIKTQGEPLEKYYFVVGGYKPYQVGYGKSIKGDFPQIEYDVTNRVYHSSSKIDDSYFPD